MVTEDDKNSSRHIIQVDQGGLSLPNKDYYLKNDTDSKKVVDIIFLYILMNLISQQCMFLSKGEFHTTPQR